MTETYKTIAFQGAHGAYSDMACRAVFPELETLPCHSFDEAFRAVIDKKADLAMIPVITQLRAGCGCAPFDAARRFRVIGEHFQPVRHKLLA